VHATRIDRIGAYDAPVASTADRLAELEQALTDANRQLLERDDELIRIARDKELAAARETLQAFERQLQAFERQLHGYQGDIEHLNRTIAEMQATRAWRFAVMIRERRAALRRLLPGRR
jgi:chromosome segregation ATPase